MSKRYLFTAIVFILWIAGFYLASDLTGLELATELYRLNLFGLILGFLFYGLAVGTGIYVLYRCLKYVGLAPPLHGISKAWIFGSFLDNITPTIMPLGEASMAYFLEKFYRVPYAGSLAGIGMYVSSWGMSVSVFSAISVILIEYFVGIQTELLIPIIFVVFLFTMLTVGWLVLLSRKKFIEKVICKLVRLYNKIYVAAKRKKITFEPCVYLIEFERSYASLEMVLRNKRHIATSVFLFVIPQLCHVLCIYSILVFGFGAEISFFGVLLIHIVSSVAGLISFLPSGLGVYEVVAGTTLAASVPAGAAAGAVLLYRLIFVWTTNMLGGAIGVLQGIGNIRVRRGHPENLLIESSTN